MSEINKIFFYKTPWLPVYTVFCVLGSFSLLLITYPLGLSVASDVVFGLFVMAGGTLGDYLFRQIIKKHMYLIGEIQALWAWPAIGLLVVLFRPFE